MPYRVLIADDDPELVKMIQLIFSREAQVQLSIACDGATALRIALEAPPDLALLDMMMPGLNGVEVCRELKRNGATAQVPVVILSAFLTAEAQAAAREAGVVEYWHKPIGVAQLREQVMERLRGNRHADR